MAALSPLLICALCFGHGARTPCRQRFGTDIARAAKRFALPRSWICAVIEIESGGHTQRDGVPIVSATGAMGLMQLMPHTFKAMALRYDLHPDPFAPRQNILAGTAYLYRCYRRFGFPLLFSAYEAGPGRVENFILHGEPLPRQTRHYVLHILHALAGAPAVMVSLKPTTTRSLFVVASDGTRLFVSRVPQPAARNHHRRRGTGEP